MARLADRLGVTLASLSRVLAGKRKLPDAVVQGTHALILERVWDESVGKLGSEGGAEPEERKDGAAPTLAGPRADGAMPIHLPPPAVGGSGTAASASP
jgi:transcriptional regulator with XRE-family HTH domain